jgi:arginyl-tRNA synthetase
MTTWDFKGVPIWGNDQIKREDQLPEETPTETYARFAQRVFDVARVIHQELQTIAEKVAAVVDMAT